MERKRGEYYLFGMKSCQWLKFAYIWCMNYLDPIPRNAECFATVIRSKNNVVMYDVTIDHEIIGYFVGIKSDSPAETFIEFIDREAANTFFDKLGVRVEMAKRGICLN